MNSTEHSITHKNEKKGIGALYLASFFWGSAFVAQKILVDAGIPPFYMVGLRMFFTLFLIVFITKIPLKSKTIKKGALMGFIIFLVFSLQTYGLKTIESSVSAFITSLNLVLIPIISFIVFRSKIVISNIISIIIALMGIYFFNISDDFNIIWNIGVILTILCAVFCAIQLVVGNHIIKEEHPLQLTIVQNLFCGLYAFIFAFFFEGGIAGFPTKWSFNSLLAITYLGIMASSTCFFLLSFGQKYVKNVVKVGLIMSLQPLFTIIIALPLLGEKLTLFKILGMIFVMGAIAIDEYSLYKRSYTKGYKE